MPSIREGRLRSVRRFSERPRRQNSRPGPRTGSPGPSTRRGELGGGEREVRHRRAGLDAPGLRQVDPLVGEVDLEHPVAGQLQGDADGERAPPARVALEVHVAAEELGQLADDRQAQAGPRCSRVRTGRPGPTRRPGGTSRRSAPVLLGDADAGVGHLDDDVPPLGVGPERDPAALGRELDRVGEQVVQDLLQLARVLPQQRDRLVEPALAGRCSSSRPAAGTWSASPSQTSRIEKSSVRTSILPLSILARSRMSLIRPSSFSPRGLDVGRVPPLAFGELLAAGEDLAEAEDPVKRRAQLVAHRRQEVALEPVRSRTGAMLAWASSSTLRSRSALTLRSSSCMATRLRSMRLKAWREVLELVAGLDLAADVQLARRDGVGDVLQVLDRLDDDVADDDVRGHHDQDRRDQGRRDQDGPVAVDRLLRLLQRTG